jgi:hypothetical protein
MSLLAILVGFEESQGRVALETAGSLVRDDAIPPELCSFDNLVVGQVDFHPGKVLT